MYCCSCFVCVVILCVIVLLCVHCFFFTLDAGLPARSQYSEGPATGHFDTGLSCFPCAKQQMLRWFPRFQVVTTCYSCSPYLFIYSLTYLLTCLLTYLLTYLLACLLACLLTYSMVQSPSREANWFAASQEIPRISRNPKVH